MDLKVIEKKEEPLLSRTKITSQLNFDAGTPSEKDVKSKLASSLNSNENLIVIKSIYTNFGFKKADVTAYLYKDEKEMESIEIKPKEKKEKKAEEKKPEKQESKKAEKSKEKAQPEESKEQKPQDTKESKEEKKEATKEEPKK